MQSTHPSTPSLVAVLVAGLGTLTSVSAAPGQDLGTMPPIAHAGGGLAETTYTNSIEALEANAEAYELFEIDLLWTSDGQLVCLHDWDDNSRRVFGRGFVPPPTLAEFEELAAEQGRWTNCTLESLAAWMAAHPGKRLVTDIKERNVEALAAVAVAVEGAETRVIPQIYQPEELGPVRAMGFKDIIWTLYQYGGSDDDVVRLAPEMDLLAVTMPKGRARAGLAERLGDIPTYVHTVNKAGEAKAFIELGVDGLFTDWLGRPAAAP